MEIRTVMSVSSSAPIVVVYDSDVTYNQVTSQTGESDIYDKLTYELLLDTEKKNQIQVKQNKPQSLIGRAFADVFGLFVLYGVTFILCDLYNTFSTGKWTSLAWMFLGPWNALTGAPLLHKITKVFDKVDSNSRAVNRCNSKYQTTQKECSLGRLDFGWDDQKEYDDCMNSARDSYKSCMENTPDYKECIREGDETGKYCMEGGDNPQCYAVHSSDWAAEESECLGYIGYDPEQ